MSVDVTKIKVGDWVMIRKGKWYTVQDVAPSELSDYSVRITFNDRDGNMHLSHYTEDGFYWPDKDECSHDILKVASPDEAELLNKHIPEETSEETHIDTTKIKVGDKIRLRNGETHTVTEYHWYPDHKTIYPVFVNGDTYTAEGFYTISHRCDFDIVEIIHAESSEETPISTPVSFKEAMGLTDEDYPVEVPIDATKIKVGDTVILRSGQKEVVKKVIPAGESEESHSELIGIELENPAYKIISGHILKLPRVYYHENGRCTLKQESSSDIVKHIPAISEEEPTMTLRDQFAMAAMNGMVSRDVHYETYKYLAEFSYQVADEMMKARKENN